MHRSTGRRLAATIYLPLGAVEQGPILDSHAATPVSIGPTTLVNELLATSILRPLWAQKKIDGWLSEVSSGHFFGNTPLLRGVFVSLSVG